MYKLSIALLAAIACATPVKAEDGPRIMEIPTVFEPVAPRAPLAAVDIPSQVGSTSTTRDRYMLLRQGGL